MCDTIVALGSATTDGAVIFGKNSDREPNEGHHLLRIPRTTHDPGSSVQCTYITIPQVEETYEVLLAKPFWMWGAEMGANEYGVVIGNEAVFTKVPYEKEGGLLGMDLIRLGLERSRSAREALDTITALLKAHGQGGSGGFTHDFYYHNSFIIADPTSAWVLETAGRQWAAQQVQEIGTISNGLTIGADWDLASDDLVTYAIDRGWCKGRDDFHFADCYSDFLYTTFSFSRARQVCTADLLRDKHGSLDVAQMIGVLRHHGPASPDADENWSPATGIANRQICQHAGFGPIRFDQTTGSMVSHLTPDVQTHFVTGTSGPCTSVFKPVWMGADLPDTGPTPTGTYDASSLFWRHEVLHRATLRNYAERHRLYADERDQLEGAFITEALNHADNPPVEREVFSRKCFEDAKESEIAWTGRINASRTGVRQGLLYGLAWRQFNDKAEMPELP